MKRHVRVLSLLAVLALALLGASYGKSDKATTAKPAAAPQVDISTLPEYLRYPGATAVERLEVNTEDSKGTSWLLVSTDPEDKVSAWYSASVEKNGWAKDPAGQKVGVLEWVSSDNTQVLKLVLCPKDGKTSISFTLGLKR